MPPPRAPGLIIKKSGGQYSGAGDDDINDVAAMGGVNLSEEAQVRNRKLFADVRVEKYLCLQKIGAADSVGSIIRSCKDTVFLQNGLLSQKINRICKEKVINDN